MQGKGPSGSREKLSEVFTTDSKHIVSLHLSVWKEGLFSSSFISPLD